MTNRTCTAEDCDKKVIARGLCTKHYQQAAKVGFEPLPPPMNTLKCSVDGCTNPALSRGLCNGHYQRFRATGDVQADVPLQIKRRGRTETCSVEGCDEAYEAKGLCHKHYAEARQARLSQDLCKIDGCERPRHTADGLCAAHYQRLLQFGDPLAGPPMRRQRGTGLSYSKPMEAEYYARHRMIRSECGAAWNYQCTHCGGQAEDWATIHDRDGESVADYMPLCKSCHHKYDGLVANLPAPRSGQDHPMAKLNDSLVREIRARAANGEPRRDLAGAFGVSLETITGVVLFRTWKHVA